MMEMLGNRLMIALHEMQHGDDEDFLRLHPGNSTQNLFEGLGRLKRSDVCADWTDEDHKSFERIVRDDFEKLSPLCESPIEREVLALLLTAPWPWKGAMPPFLLDKGQRPPQGATICLRPQFEIGRSRLDFALFIPRHVGGHMLTAIECDGREFHSRLEDANRDRELLTKHGVRTLRYSGTDIRRDPWRIYDELVEYACMWAEV